MRGYAPVLHNACSEDSKGSSPPSKMQASSWADDTQSSYPPDLLRQAKGKELMKSWSGPRPEAKDMLHDSHRERLSQQGRSAVGT